jgi:hypothetical protein
MAVRKLPYFPTSYYYLCLLISVNLLHILLALCGFLNWTCGSITMITLKNNYKYVELKLSCLFRALSRPFVSRLKLLEPLFGMCISMLLCIMIVIMIILSLFGTLPIRSSGIPTELWGLHTCSWCSIILHLSMSDQQVTYRVVQTAFTTWLTVMVAWLWKYLKPLRKFVWSKAELIYQHQAVPTRLGTA